MLASRLRIASEINRLFDRASYSILRAHLALVRIIRLSYSPHMVLEKWLLLQRMMWGQTEEKRDKGEKGTRRTFHRFSDTSEGRAHF